MRLALDTSGVDQAMVALEGDRAPALDDWVRQRDDPPVMARLQALVERAGGRPADIEMVAAARGPGSFTGLRVGLSIAAGLAYARHIPLYVMDSLPLLARRVRGEPASIVLRDAGRGEVFAWRREASPVRIATAELAEWLPAAGLIIVEPAGRLAQWLPAAAPREVPATERRPLTEALRDYAIWTFEARKPLRYDEVQALYVQPAAAEERRRKAM
jgi:tRNA threonylcarbamoyl adenosine modification protein YeaZ